MKHICTNLYTDPKTIIPIHCANHSVYRHLSSSLKFCQFVWLVRSPQAHLEIHVKSVVTESNRTCNLLGLTCFDNTCALDTAHRMNHALYMHDPKRTIIRTKMLKYYPS